MTSQRLQRRSSPCPLAKINSKTSYLQTRAALGGLRSPEKLQQHSGTNTRSNCEKGRKSSSILPHRPSPQANRSAPRGSSPAKEFPPQERGRRQLPQPCRTPHEAPGSVLFHPETCKPRCLDSQDHGGGRGLSGKPCSRSSRGLQGPALRRTPAGLTTFCPIQKLQPPEFLPSPPGSPGSVPAVCPGICSYGSLGCRPRTPLPCAPVQLGPPAVHL